ncbi:MAG: hypothetical protein LLF84_01740 [Methanoregulaceae archaeon]|nr:hypothetical protein [Methanoregulaceae archaeon]
MCCQAAQAGKTSWQEKITLTHQRRRGSYPSNPFGPDVGPGTPPPIKGPLPTPPGMEGVATPPLFCIPVR